MAFGEENGLLDYAIIFDATRSGGGSLGAYAVQRIQGKPFKTTFGTLRLSDVIEPFVQDKREDFEAQRIYDGGGPETVDDGTWLMDWLAAYPGGLLVVSHDLQLLDESITSVFDALDGDRLTQLVSPLVRAGTTWILSGESSLAGARTLHSGLAMVRPGVRLLEEPSYGTDLGDAQRGDAAVVIDFVRYRRQTVAATGILVDAGVTIVAITDSPLSPLVELADVWTQIKVPAVGPFDSSISVVALCELLVAQATKELREDATNRIDRIEALWERSETFV